jgi:hypothetical protein
MWKSIIAVNHVVNKTVNKERSMWVYQHASFYLSLFLLIGTIIKKIKGII